MSDYVGTTQSLYIQVDKYKSDVNLKDGITDIDVTKINIKELYTASGKHEKV